MEAILTYKGMGAGGPKEMEAPHGSYTRGPPTPAIKN